MSEGHVSEGQVSETSMSVERTMAKPSITANLKLDCPVLQRLTNPPRDLIPNNMNVKPKNKLDIVDKTMLADILNYFDCDIGQSRRAGVVN